MIPSVVKNLANYKQIDDKMFGIAKCKDSAKSVLKPQPLYMNRSRVSEKTLDDAWSILTYHFVNQSLKASNEVNFIPKEIITTKDAVPLILAETRGYKGLPDGVTQFYLSGASRLDDDATFLIPIAPTIACKTFDFINYATVVPSLSLKDCLSTDRKRYELVKAILILLHHGMGVEIFCAANDSGAAVWLHYRFCIMMDGELHYTLDYPKPKGPKEEPSRFIFRITSSDVPFQDCQRKTIRGYPTGPGFLLHSFVAPPEIRTKTNAYLNFPVNNRERACAAVEEHASVYCWGVRKFQQKGMLYRYNFSFAVTPATLFDCVRNFWNNQITSSQDDLGFFNQVFMTEWTNGSIIPLEVQILTQLNDAAINKLSLMYTTRWETTPFPYTLNEQAICVTKMMFPEIIFKRVPHVTMNILIRLYDLNDLRKQCIIKLIGAPIVPPPNKEWNSVFESFQNIRIELREVNDQTCSLLFTIEKGCLIIHYNLLMKVGGNNPMHYFLTSIVPFLTPPLKLREDISFVPRIQGKDDMTDPPEYPPAPNTKRMRIWADIPQ